VAGLYPYSGSDTMHLSISEPLDVIKWGYRFLYLLLFVSLMVVMGYWQSSVTIPFLGAVLALLLPLIFSREELLSEEGEIAESIECTEVYIDTQ
jgi:hypothetical protein